MAGQGLDWELLESHYEDERLILFEKRIDRLRNPRNGKAFERLVLESADWVNVVALDEQRRSVTIRQYRFGFAPRHINQLGVPRTFASAMVSKPNFL
jgi:hypothetical protein